MFAGDDVLVREFAHPDVTSGLFGISGAGGLVGLAQPANSVAKIFSYRVGECGGNGNGDYPVRNASTL